jgi:ribosomal protein S6
MVHERFLRTGNNNRSWRIISNSRNDSFDGIIRKARANWQSAHKKGNTRLAKEIAAKFNRNYETWLIKAKKEVNAKRRHNSNFMASLIAAKRSGNASRVNNVLKKFNKPPPKSPQVLKSPPKSFPVARHSPSVARSGKPRWNTGLRQAIAARNYKKLANEARRLNEESEKLANAALKIRRQLRGLNI